MSILIAIFIITFITITITIFITITRWEAWRHVDFIKNLLSSFFPVCLVCMRGFLYLLHVVALITRKVLQESAHHLQAVLQWWYSGVIMVLQ
jgi:hypothetical protein